MKPKKNKMSNKERDRQLNYLFQAMYELSQELRMVRGLFENYLIWKKDVKKYTKYLEKEEKRKSKEREAQPAEGSGTPEAGS